MNKETVMEELVSVHLKESEWSAIIALLFKELYWMDQERMSLGEERGPKWYELVGIGEYIAKRLEEG